MPATKQSNRRNAHTWLPGQSGNPNGRPKTDADIAALCRVHTAEAVQHLVKAMRTSPRDRVPAAIALLDRGWGRPKQQLEVSADADAIGLHLTAARALVAAFAEAEAEAGQPPPPAPTVERITRVLQKYDDQLWTERAAREIAALTHAGTIEGRVDRDDAETKGSALDAPAPTE